MKESNDINIAIALNSNVIIQSYVLLVSIAVNIKSHVNLYVLHSSLSNEELSALQTALNTGKEDSLNDLIEVKIDEDDFKGLPFNQFWSIEAYYRLILPELLGNKIDRILYLDVDIIVNKDITEFYNMDFDGSDMIVSKDMEFDNAIIELESQNQKRKALFLHLKEKGAVYFCSGMLLMNLKQMKEKYTFKFYIDKFNSIKDSVVLFDQDLLNYVHYDKVHYVDEYKYGMFTQTAHKQGITYEQAKNNTYILHFSGKSKPWTINLIRYDIEKIWWEYAKLTGFYYNLMEQVFIMSMESTLVEEEFDKLSAKNTGLKEVVNEYRAIINTLK